MPLQERTMAISLPLFGASAISVTVSGGRTRKRPAASTAWPSTAPEAGIRRPPPLDQPGFAESTVTRT